MRMMLGQQGGGGRGGKVESRGETRWQTTCLDELVLVFEAELHILE